MTGTAMTDEKPTGLHLSWVQFLFALAVQAVVIAVMWGQHLARDEYQDQRLATLESLKLDARLASIETKLDLIQQRLNAAPGMKQ
jgi:hypothetical protein